MWNKVTERWLSNATRKIKRKRVEMFVATLDLGPQDIVLDLGSEDGSYLSSYYPYPRRIVLADIREETIKKGCQKYGLGGYVVIPESGPLPFADKEYDAVWCNSAIEHVTISKDDLGNVGNKKFFESSNAHQIAFAREISRIGRKYFVQTPNMHFPLESHSWLPFIQYLPQPWRYHLSKILKKIWLKQWSADFLLYDQKRFRKHFHDAKDIRAEKLFGMIKAFIAIKN